MLRMITRGAAALLLTACVGHSPHQGQPSDAMPVAGAARLFVTWTIGGLAPSQSSCAGVDHLDLTVLSDHGSDVVISPIPCAINRVRYDHLAEGPATVRLEAFDAGACRLGWGQARATLTTDLPALPSPTIPISALAGCGR